MMTREDALAEARRRWGPQGEALSIVDTIGTFGGLGIVFRACVGEPSFEVMCTAKAHFSVGIWNEPPELGYKYITKGEGGSWEEALADADARQE
jgi:hypothetical protein